MSKTILIIDNDVDVLDIMQEALNYEGFEVVTSAVADGYENLIRRNQADLLIIDYILQGVNGGEICHQIKCSPDLGHLPVIIFSAYPRVMETSGSYSCDLFIPKPFDLLDLVDQITRLLHCSSNHFFSDQGQVDA
jgi:DNA-binding response OmpR family regulator